jgi:hypothetical protein
MSAFVVLLVEERELFASKPEIILNDPFLYF